MAEAVEVVEVEEEVEEEEGEAVEEAVEEVVEEVVEEEAGEVVAVAVAVVSPREVVATVASKSGKLTCCRHKTRNPTRKQGV